MRYVCHAAAALSTVFCFVSPLLGQGGQGLSIANYQFVSQEIYSRTQSYFTYRADLVNTGSSRTAVTATLTSLVPSIQLVPGQASLHFGPVPSNGSVTSTDTFTVLVDRTIAFDFANLQWSFLAPLANAGRSQTVAVGTTVTLDGTGSSNPSGMGSLSYKWTLVSRPFGTATTIIGYDTAIATFRIDVPGTYIAGLTVSNGFGSDTATVAFSTTNSPPVADAGPSQTVALGSTVTLNGGGSSDVDGNALTYAWTLVSRPTGSVAALGNPTTVSPTFVADKPGTYVAQLVVNDGQVSSGPSTVHISTRNSAPVANAGSGGVVATGSIIHLDGSKSTDVDGDPLTYSWTFNSLPNGSVAKLSDASAVNPTFTADAPGTYIVQLVVNDGLADSAAATATFSTSTARAPTANAGLNQTVKHGATVTLDGSGTDPQNLPLTFRWSFTTKPAGSAAVLSNAGAAKPTFVADVPGTYIVS